MSRVVRYIEQLKATVKASPFYVGKAQAAALFVLDSVLEKAKEPSKPKLGVLKST